MDSHKVYLGCCLVILNPAGNRVLLAKRKVDPDKGGWQIPGGTVDCANGENLEDAAVREALEETGVTVESPAFLCLMNTFYYGKERPVHVAFVARATSDLIPLNPESHKAEDWFWADLKNLPEGKWFRMSREAILFYTKSLTNSDASRFVLDADYPRATQKE